MIEQNLLDKSILYCLGKPKHDDCAIIDLRLNQVGRRYYSRQFTLAGEQ